jgi:hypothetical protein
LQATTAAEKNVESQEQIPPTTSMKIKRFFVKYLTQGKQKKTTAVKAKSGNQSVSES